jgi:hypothetical protein
MCTKELELEQLPLTCRESSLRAAEHVGDMELRVLPGAD